MEDSIKQNAKVNWTRVFNALLKEYKISICPTEYLADISDDDLKLVVDMINNHPRKRLNYLTPFEVLKKFFS